jgi:hypothetical protein
VIFLWEQLLGAVNERIGILAAPILARLKGKSGGLGIDRPQLYLPAMLIRPASMECSGFDPRTALYQTNGHNIVGDMCRVFLMVTERSYGIFTRREAMGIGCRPNRRVTNGCGVEREQSLIAKRRSQSTANSMTKSCGCCPSAIGRP